jgi:hypothetical protein
VGKALLHLTLLCSASAIAMSVVGSAHAGQASLSSFQTYDPTMASTIALGATFDGEFSDVTRPYAGKGVARYSW